MLDYTQILPYLFLGGELKCFFIVSLLLFLVDRLVQARPIQCWVSSYVLIINSCNPGSSCSKHHSLTSSLRGQLVKCFTIL